MATSAKDTKTKTAARKTARASGETSAKATPEARKKRSQAVASKAQASKAAQKAQSGGKGLADLFEHALADIYYAEKKIYKSLPKMIKAADHPDLIAALTQHREETAGQIDKLEEIFALLDQRPRAEKCEAIDGILEEGDSLLEDFGDSMAADAAIIFSCQAVEHYEITRYGSMAAFAEALGMDEAKALLDEILAQESATDIKLSALAEDSVNDAASDYDADSEAA